VTHTFAVLAQRPKLPHNGTLSIKNCAREA